MMCAPCLQDVILENRHFILTIGPDCTAKSLRLKSTGEECLLPGTGTALFSLTENRLYNNEIKLAYPSKRTTFSANRLRREGDKLIVGFELVTFEAEVTVRETADYIAFTLTGFRIKPEDFDYLSMTPPPVAEFRLLQLPVKPRARFGQWLNVMWDEAAAVAVVGAGPFARIDSEDRRDHRLLYADALRGIQLKGCTAALIASVQNQLLDCVDTLERDYDLPRGVESRRSGAPINSSIYWSQTLTPENVDQQIARAKQGGFRMMLLYYYNFFKEGYAYTYCGDYDYNEHYPNGLADVKYVVDKIKAAGITPGLHFLHTHIGLKSRYVTPVADHRLHLTRHFTLAKPLGETDDVVWVEQNPEGAELHPDCRVLQFGGELIWYEGYTTQRPYSFFGCRRGYLDTIPKAHDRGTIGGTLDISEYFTTSVYIDQETSLQDEIADKLAQLYSAGFSFVYFDGSEGTQEPFEIYIPYAQYRVYQRLQPAPLFCEGAAKAHFSWHMLSGGNAFDSFPMAVFKERLARHPLEEAGRMADDFTRVNFGWWTYDDETQPDLYEYGTSKAAAWDCPITIQTHLERFASNPRTDDILEVMRRWEDVRAKNWLTAEQKLALRNPEREFTLLLDVDGDYELIPCHRLSTGKDLTAYCFTRQSRTWVVCWHTRGAADLFLPIGAEKLQAEPQFGSQTVMPEPVDGGCRIPVAGRQYYSTNLSAEQLAAAFARGQLLPETK